jgi:hypothetical protein
MHRVFVALVLISGLLLSSGCTNRSTDPVYRNDKGSGRMKKQDPPEQDKEAGSKAGKEKKENSLIPK